VGGGREGVFYQWGAKCSGKNSTRKFSWGAEASSIKGVGHEGPRTLPGQRNKRSVDGEGNNNGKTRKGKRRKESEIVPRDWG